MSVEDARKQADLRVVKLAELFQSGMPLEQYGYGERPLREEIIETVHPGSLVVTRNLYGALVLNTAHAMFIDIDFTAASEAFRVNLLGRLFGKASRGANAQQLALEHLRQWSTIHRDLGMRVYRTFGGLRCLVTSRTFDPTSEAALDLLRGIGSDPLYVRLCQAQSCFRARLTPKPWRCRMRPPTTPYPWESSENESRFRRWLSEYERITREYSVCRLIDQIGPAGMHPEIAPIIALHDRFACSQPERPLA